MSSFPLWKDVLAYLVGENMKRCRKFGSMANKHLTASTCIWSFSPARLECGLKRGFKSASQKLQPNRENIRCAYLISVQNRMHTNMGPPQIQRSQFQIKSSLKKTSDGPAGLRPVNGLKDTSNLRGAFCLWLHNRVWLGMDSRCPCSPGHPCRKNVMRRRIHDTFDSFP